MNKWNNIVNCIKEYDNIVILTHTNMDGDALGSASALCCALRSMGKNVLILLEDRIARYLNVINHDLNFDSDPYFVTEMPYIPDLAIVVDCGDETRIEKRIDAYRAAKMHICIDHHIQTESFADHRVVEENKAATGMLIFELINELGVCITKEMAEYLYVAIVTDTGRFKYSNTTAEAHEMVSKLLKCGIDGARICNFLYDSYPVEQLKAEAHAQDAMELFSNNKAVISSIEIEDMKRIGVSYDQIDTCIDRIRIIDGVEIAAFLKEKEPNVFKLSLRSKCYADVNRVANALGGGGHVRASGATLYMSKEEAYKFVMTEIEKELSRY